MPIHTFPEHKVLFIKVPATGGGSFWISMQRNFENIEIIPPKSIFEMDKFIGNENLFTARQVRAYVDEEIWNTYEKIAFVRHPVRWLNSIYYKANGMSHYGIRNDMPFPYYVKAVRYTPYDWLVDNDGKVIVDTIYRTEDLDTVVFPRFNLRPYHYNVRFRPEKKRDIVPTEDDMKIIRKKFAREYQHYEKETS